MCHRELPILPQQHQADHTHPPHPLPGPQATPGGCNGLTPPALLPQVVLNTVFATPPKNLQKFPFTLTVRAKL